MSLLTSMTNKEISHLKNVFSALANEKRLQILFLCRDKPRNVTELSKLLKLNYSITVEYTSMLEKVGLIKKERYEDHRVYVKALIDIKENGEISKILI